MLSKFKKKKGDAEEESAVMRAIGTVEMVNPQAGFVIVHTLSNVPVAPGTELTAVNTSGVSGKLRVSPEHKTIFITADIVSGSPSKGDTVLSGSAPAVAAAPAVVTPGTPLAPVAGIPEANLLRSASPLPGTPGAQPGPPPSLPLPLPQQEEFLRVVPPGAPR